MGEPAGLLMALTVAKWGWRVAPGFVTKDGSKVPFCGGDWTKKATTVETQLREWWAERPWLWPGIVGGPGSCLVVDCDGPAGVSAFRDLVSSVGGWVSGGLTYRTPGRGGGLHCAWSWPGWLDVGFRQAKWFVEGGEIQLRGTGHWTLLGGANRPDLQGQYSDYVFLEEPGPGGPIEAPEAIVRGLMDKGLVSIGSGPGGFSSEIRELTPEEAWSSAPWSDGRKNALAGLAWYQAIRGLDVESVCESFNKECCLPPLPDSVVRAKVNYAIDRAGKAREKMLKEYEQAMASLRRFHK